MPDYLKEGLAKLNFTQEQIDFLVPKFELYINELRLFNSAYNLVNTDNHDEIVINHILDSLAPICELKKLVDSFTKIRSEMTELEKSTKIIIGDIGSGGGLPGIPLATAFLSMTDVKFYLVERMSKRCAFLENCAAIMGLTNVTVKNAEAEKVESDSIDIAVFRAFRPLDIKMTKTLLKLLAPNGFLAAYKAKKEKITEEMSQISSVVKNYEIKSLYVPFLTDSGDKEQRERNLVIIQKTTL